jgi:hypothetical protein
MTYYDTMDVLTRFAVSNDPEFEPCMPHLIHPQTMKHLLLGRMTITTFGRFFSFLSRSLSHITPTPNGF